MKYALFAISQPDDPTAWRQFVEILDLRLKEHEKRIARPAETVWLVDNQAAPAALAWLIVTAESRKISYAIASFDSAPEWLLAGFDPRTNQA